MQLPEPALPVIIGLCMDRYKNRKKLERKQAEAKADALDGSFTQEDQFL